MSQQQLRDVDYIDYVNPYEAWAHGIPGWFLRWRGIACSALAESGLTIVAFLWTHWSICLTVVLTGLAGIGFLLLVRHYRVCRYESDVIFHEFCYAIRDIAGLEGIVHLPEETCFTGALALVWRDSQIVATAGCER